MTETPTPAAGLIRLSEAARRAGLNPRAMASALNSREIPISRVQLGNLSFVRAAELNQWLTAPAPAAASADLFA